MTKIVDTSTNIAKTPPPNLQNLAIAFSENRCRSWGSAERRDLAKELAWRQYGGSVFVEHIWNILKKHSWFFVVDLAQSGASATIDVGGVAHFGIPVIFPKLTQSGNKSLFAMRNTTQ